MRNAFFATLAQSASSDERIIFLTGDLGFGAIEPFADRFPDRFINVGVAEQNMTGLAAGLALTGSVVFTYSIANFPTIRCLEQLRNDVCYHHANVKVVAVGGGLAYGSLGVSHHATEDLAILRSLPGLLVAAPGDPWEVESIVGTLVETEGPAYLRLGKTGEPRVHSGPVQLPVGSSMSLRSGSDVGLISTGAILPTVLEAAEKLSSDGIEATVVSMPWVSPLDYVAVERLCSDVQLVVTIEEHSTTGGLGGAVAEVVSENGKGAPLLRIGLRAGFLSTVGSQEYLRSTHGLDADSICQTILERLRGL